MKMEEERKIKLGDSVVSYKLKKSRRARHMRLSVGRNAEVTMTVPWGLWGDLAEKFMRQKAGWILGKIDYFQKNNSQFPLPNRKDYLKYKKLAREIAEKKLARFNVFYGFSWKKISIRNTKTRWGSCSKSGSLSFSYRIIYLPEEISDYIVIHELCHLGEFNHSKKFWNLVQKIVPDYKKIRKALKKI